MIKLKTFMHCKGGQFCHVSIKIVISKENNGLGKTFLRMPGLPKDQYFFMLWPFNKRMSPERWTQTNNRTQQRLRVKNYCFLWVKRRIHNRILRSTDEGSLMWTISLCVENQIIMFNVQCPFVCHPKLGVRVQ